MPKARVTCLSLRPAVAGDAVAIISFAECAFGEAHMTLPAAEADGFSGVVRGDKEASAWFIVADGERIGFLVMDLEFSFEAGRRLGALEDVYLLPAYRGRRLVRPLATLAGLAADALALDGLSLNRGRRRVATSAAGPARRVARRCGAHVVQSEESRNHEEARAAAIGQYGD